QQSYGGDHGKPALRRGQNGAHFTKRKGQERRFHDGVRSFAKLILSSPHPWRRKRRFARPCPLPFRKTAMSLEPLLSAHPIIQLHAYAGALAFFLGGVVLFRRKGDKTHKRLGMVWVWAMVTISVTSFFIWELRMFGLFSPIHLLSILTLAALWQAVRFARQRQIV